MICAASLPRSDGPCRYRVVWRDIVGIGRPVTCLRPDTLAASIWRLSRSSSTTLLFSPQAFTAFARLGIPMPCHPDVLARRLAYFNLCPQTRGRCEKHVLFDSSSEGSSGGLSALTNCLLRFERRSLRNLATVTRQLALVMIRWTLCYTLQHASGWLISHGQQRLPPVGRKIEKRIANG